MAKFRQPPQSAAEATIVSKTIAANGTYYASADSADGYDPVVVEVPGEHATIVSKNITANGTYNASSDSADGYNPVTVAVPEKVIKSKNITANGTYNASQDSADGFDPVVVAVPAPVIKSKSITANGTYNASSDNADGFDPVVVAVPGPVLGNKSVTANGTYTAAADGYDGFSSVTVAVSGGAQATITVSYDSYFYNKTMTCSDGTTTYTETTTSAGSTVFSVNTSGTWTITCDGYTKTVDVVLDYLTQMTVTVTIDVYGAASDTMTYTDATGAKTVTTNLSGYGSADVTIIPSGQSITFTSGVAKNPSDLTSYYSKAITIAQNTTAIYVMPGTTLYWYGFENSALTGGEDLTTWAREYTSRPISKGTANINSYSCGGVHVGYCGYGTINKIDITSYTDLKVILSSATGQYLNYYSLLQASSNKTVIGAVDTQPSSAIPQQPVTRAETTGVTSLDITSYNGDYAIGYYIYNTDTSVMTALWLE